VTFLVATVYRCYLSFCALHCCTM